MAKEKPTYRLELEQLKSKYPDKTVLTKTDIMEYTGRGRRWMDSHGFKGKGDLTIVQVAAILSNLI